jgi:hypothetical protein
MGLLEPRLRFVELDGRLGMSGWRLRQV